MSYWSQLPDDILLLIFNNLPKRRDRIIFCCICSSWRSWTLRYEARPLLPLPGVLITNSGRGLRPKRRFSLFTHPNPYNTYTNVRHGLPLLSLPQHPRAIYAPMSDDEFLIIGSSEGWLVVVEPPLSIHLTNPITRVKVQLPSIETTPGWSEGPFKEERDFLYEQSWAYSVQKAVLSGSPRTCTEASPPCYVMVLFGNWRKVPFCKIGDTAWNCVEIPRNGNERETEHIWSGDAIYCKGLFYIASIEVGKLYAFGSCCSSPCLSEIVGFLPQTRAYWRCVRFYHLAELEGQLLLIFRDVLRSISSQETLEFKVYKLDTQNNNWVATRSLGDYALFLGRHQSFYMLKLDAPVIKANSIYVLRSWINPEIEIFRLDDFGIESFNFNIQPKSRRLVWFTPTLWDLKGKDAEHGPYVKPRVEPKEPQVMQMHRGIANISNKFSALIDDDNDQSHDDDSDDDSALSD